LTSSRIAGTKDAFPMIRGFKLLFKFFLLLGFLAMLAFGYDFYLAKSNGYPREIVLMNQDLRAIQVRVEGRTDSHVHMTKLEDNRFYVYPIENLTWLSRFQLSYHPINSYLDKSNGRQSSDVASIHFEQVKAEHQQLAEEYDNLKKQMRSAESKIKQRTIRREMERLSARIAKLEKSLQDAEKNFTPLKRDRNASTDAISNGINFLLESVTE
jgi:hypothetical protein